MSTVWVPDRPVTLSAPTARSEVLGERQLRRAAADRHLAVGELDDLHVIVHHDVAGCVGESGGRERHTAHLVQVGVGLDDVVALELVDRVLERGAHGGTLARRQIVERADEVAVAQVGEHLLHRCLRSLGATRCRIARRHRGIGRDATADQHDCGGGDRDGLAVSLRTGRRAQRLRGGPVLLGRRLRPALLRRGRPARLLLRRCPALGRRRGRPAVLVAGAGRIMRCGQLVPPGYACA